MPITRREFLEAGAAGLVTGLVAACDTGWGADGSSAARELSSRPTVRDSQAARQLSGRLSARPHRPSGAAAPGLRRLELGDQRDGMLYVPNGYTPERAAPLVLMLHGAGGSARGGIRPFQALADEHGLVLLVPDSRGSTWDVITDDYGPDVAFIDRAMAEAFQQCAVDPARLAVEGFSDGASYALGLGLTNGDLFTHIVAFSPGFVPPVDRRGAPRVYISHGTRDQILPIESCSRRIVPALKRAKLDVRYQEFDGPHTVPPDIAREAASWITTRAG